METIKKIIFFFLITFLVFFNIFAQSEKKENKNNYKKEEKVTFIELGSDKCLPCKTMKSVIKQIEEKYKDKVEIIYYDIWTKEGRPYADKYKIKVIPTQIFLDKDGKEFYRHEGFFSFNDIDKLLKNKLEGK